MSWDVTTGKLLAERWTPKTGFEGGVDGLYWNSGKILNPGAKAGPFFKENLGERWIALWVAIDVEQHNGYRLRVIVVNTTTVEWKLEKVTKGEVAELAGGTLEGFVSGANEDLFALTVVDGVVRAWQLVDGEGEWTELGNAEDSTYTEGYVGIEGRGTGICRWDIFYSGELEEEGEAGGDEVAPPPASALASALTPTLAIMLSPPTARATASIPPVEVAAGPAVSPTDQGRKGLPLPHPSILANPARLGPPRFTALERKALGID